MDGSRTFAPRALVFGRRNRRNGNASLRATPKGRSAVLSTPRQTYERPILALGSPATSVNPRLAGTYVNKQVLVRTLERPLCGKFHLGPELRLAAYSVEKLDLGRRWKNPSPFWGAEPESARGNSWRSWQRSVGLPDASTGANQMALRLRLDLSAVCPRHNFEFFNRIGREQQHE